MAPIDKTLWFYRVTIYLELELFKLHSHGFPSGDISAVVLSKFAHVSGKDFTHHEEFKGHD